MKTQAQNRYLDFLIDPSSEIVNRLFVWSLKMEMIEEGTIDIFFQPQP